MDLYNVQNKILQRARSIINDGLLPNNDIEQLNNIVEYDE